MLAPSAATAAIRPRRRSSGRPVRSAPGREQRRARGEPAGEQVRRDPPVPRRRLEDRPAVVGGRVGAGNELLPPARVYSLSTPPGECAERRGQEAGGGRADETPHPHHVPGRHDRVRRQPVDLGLVQQQEERTVAADAVVRVGSVQARSGSPLARAGSPPARPPARAARPARRTGWSRSGRPWRRPVPGRRAAGRSRACTSGRGRRRSGARSRRTGSPRRSSRSRCRCPAAPPPTRTRCGTGPRSGRRPGSRRACSACRRRRPSASGSRCGSRPRSRARQLQRRHPEVDRRRTGRRCTVRRRMIATPRAAR